jgi:replicative DNA helicase
MREDILDQELPACVDAEKSLLGGIFMENGFISDAACQLHPEHFYLDAHRKIYKAFLELYDAGAPIDYESVADCLQRTRQLSAVGGKAYLSSLTDGVPKRPSLDHRISLIREKATLRSLFFAVNAVAGRITSGDESKDCIAALEDVLAEVAVNGKTGRPISDLMHDAVNEIHRLRQVQDRTLGLTLDFQPLDDSTTGIRQDELWVIGARPNVGKTPFAMQIALANARIGKQVDIYELEMSERQTSNRLLIHHGAADPWKLRDPRRMSEADVIQATEGAAEMAQLPLMIDDSGSLTVRDLRSRILAGIRKRNTKLVIVDYLQLIRGEGKRYEVTSDAAAGLREIVRKTKVPIVALSQLNRNAKDPGKPPDLADLRESGVIEQEANVVVMIHRALLKEGDQEGELSNRGKFILAKVREGIRGPEPFVFNEKRLIFEPEYMAGVAK